jgi:PEP-CTERM putative exosortase interaction domain
MQPTRKALLGLGCALYCSQSISAAIIGITNGGFEDISGETPYNEFTFGDLPGWSIYDPSGTKGDGTGGNFYVGTLQPTIIESVDSENYQYFPDGAPEGSRVGIAFNFNAGADTGEYGLQQTLSATLQANMTYTLSALVGNIASGQSLDNNTFNLDGFPGYRIDLMAGETILVSDNNSLAGSIAEGSFASTSISYTATDSDLNLGENLRIRLVNLNVTDPSFSSADLEVDFDSITLDASPVPEPTTSVLLIGLAAIASVMGRRRKRA